MGQVEERWVNSLPDEACILKQGNSSFFVFFLNNVPKYKTELQRSMGFIGAI